MKKLILALFVALTAVACGPSKEADTKTEEAPVKEQATEQTMEEATEDSSAAMADSAATEEAPEEATEEAAH